MYKAKWRSEKNKVMGRGDAEEKGKKDSGDWGDL